MGKYVEAFRAYVQEYGLSENYPQMESVVEVLYYCYCVHRDLQTEQIRKSFQQINEITAKLALNENDRISDLTCQLCNQYQREAFREGLQVGFRLLQELSSDRDLCHSEQAVGASRNP